MAGTPAPVMPETVTVWGVSAAMAAGREAGCQTRVLSPDPLSVRETTVVATGLPPRVMVTVAEAKLAPG